MECSITEIRYYGYFCRNVVGIVVIVMASTSSAFDSERQIPSKLVSEVENTTNEGDFQQTIELLQIDSEELSEEVMQSVLEVRVLVCGQYLNLKLIVLDRRFKAISLRILLKSLQVERRTYETCSQQTQS